ncbi:hypothetical protein EDB81DRAFT_948877 [Dactylonectria macrodidyma]|uniref:Uncharacterized protein n=1 Tax=Dactylonectria macrodidyma TaxID=307937 RepID=A0A9P9J0H8_9HYPO|nr:hypothetical protein EDB81DRAFT_948877 [Dactylonectria macrodidyma]
MDPLPFSTNDSLQTQIWDDTSCLKHSLLASQLAFLSCSQRREQAWRAGFNAGFDDGYRKGTDARTQVSGDGFTAASEIQPVGLGHYSNIEPDDIALSQRPILETAQHIPPDLAMFIPVESTAGSFETSNFGFGGDIPLRDSQKPPLALDAEPIYQNSPATSTSINLISHRSPPYASGSSNVEALYLADKAASYDLPADERNNAHPDQNYLLVVLAQSEERASKVPSPPLGAQIMEEPIPSSVDINTTETTTATNNLELADCAPKIYPAPDSAPICSSVNETPTASPISNSWSTGSLATTDGFDSFADSAIGSGSTDASSAATSVSSGSPGGCLSFAAFHIRSGLSDASSATTPILHDSPSASSTPSPSGLCLGPIIQAESTCLDVVESCREEDDGVALPDGTEPPDSPNSSTAMCTLNGNSRKMVLNFQLENDASNDSSAYNNPNDVNDTWESSPELHLACDTTLTRPPIIDVNGDDSWAEIESEESKNEEFADLEKPQGRRKRRSQQPLFNYSPKRARQVTPGTTPEATSEKWYFNLKSISLQNQNGRKKQEIHWTIDWKSSLNGWDSHSGFD